MIALLAVITMTLPLQNVADQYLPADLELFAHLYRCNNNEWVGYAQGFPGQQVSITDPDYDYGCWYARAQYVQSGLISAPSAQVTKTPPCINCHGGN